MFTFKEKKEHGSHAIMKKKKLLISNTDLFNLTKFIK